MATLKEVSKQLKEQNGIEEKQNAHLEHIDDDMHDLLDFFIKSRAEDLRIAEEDRRERRKDAVPTRGSSSSSSPTPSAGGGGNSLFGAAAGYGLGRALGPVLKTLLGVGSPIALAIAAREGLLGKEVENVIVGPEGRLLSKLIPGLESSTERAIRRAIGTTPTTTPGTVNPEADPRTLAEEQRIREEQLRRQVEARRLAAEAEANRIRALNALSDVDTSGYNRSPGAGASVAPTVFTNPPDGMKAPSVGDVEIYKTAAGVDQKVKVLGLGDSGRIQLQSLDTGAKFAISSPEAIGRFAGGRYSPALLAPPPTGGTVGFSPSEIDKPPTRSSVEKPIAPLPTDTTFVADTPPRAAGRGRQLSERAMRFIMNSDGSHPRFPKLFDWVSKNANRLGYAALVFDAFRLYLIISDQKVDLQLVDRFEALINEEQQPSWYPLVKANRSEQEMITEGGNILNGMIGGTAGAVGFGALAGAVFGSGWASLITSIAGGIAGYKLGKQGQLGEVFMMIYLGYSAQRIFDYLGWPIEVNAGETFEYDQLPYLMGGYENTDDGVLSPIVGANGLFPSDMQNDPPVPIGSNVGRNFGADMGLGGKGYGISGVGIHETYVPIGSDVTPDTTTTGANIPPGVLKMAKELGIPASQVGRFASFISRAGRTPGIMGRYISGFEPSGLDLVANPTYGYNRSAESIPEQLERYQAIANSFAFDGKVVQLDGITIEALAAAIASYIPPPVASGGGSAAIGAATPIIVNDPHDTLGRRVGPR